MPFNNLFAIEYLEQVIEEDIKKLPPSAKQLIRSAIEQRLAIDPIGFGKPLRYSLKGHRRLRVSAYRIVYRIIEPKTVLIVAIKHRKDVYLDLDK